MQKTTPLAIEWRSYNRFTFVENTIGNWPKVLRVELLGSDGLFCFISISCKFGSFKNPFALITSLSELHFRFRRNILLVQTKKSDFYELWQQHKQLKTIEISEDWLDTFNERYIHQFQPEPTQQNSPAAAEPLNLKIFSHVTSLKWSQRLSQSAQE